MALAAAVYAWTLLAAIGVAPFRHGFASAYAYEYQPGVPALDHFKCYRVSEEEDFDERTVQLTDEFGSATGVVEEPKRLCNPVSKNGSQVTQPEGHLLCYELRDEDGHHLDELDQRITIENQFGIQRLSVDDPERLCAPATKSLTGGTLAPPPEASMNHYTCYNASSSSFPDRRVTLVDQFRTEVVDLTHVVYFCVPVSKDGGQVHTPAAYMTCYRVDPLRDPHFDVYTRDQFTTQLLDVEQARFVCVPSRRAL